jgi:hypothetical protein
LDSLPDETILAQEQGVINRGTGALQELEGGFDASKKESEGTLILTNNRLIYARGDTTEKLSRAGGFVGAIAGGSKSIVFLDADDLDDVKSDPANLWIELKSIVSVTGHKRMAQAPKLEVRWNAGSERKTEFIQQITGSSRKKNLNDWAAVIERLKEGKQVFKPLPSAPDTATLEGRIYHLLSDYEDRGPLTIEDEVEKRYNIQLEPEDVEAACEKLVGQGLVEKTAVAGEAPFYEKVSPLGDDTLDA